MYPLERVVAEYAVRYGLLDFCESSENETGNVRILTVVEYLQDEMNFNELSFSNSSLKRVFERILSMTGDFRRVLDDKIKDFEHSLDQRRQLAYQDIASRGLDMQQIEIEEKNLEIKLEQEKSTMINDFARDYPSTLLASDSDDDIRVTATELMTDRHELSNIYRKKGDSSSDENNLFSLLPRAITEWKTELIDSQIRSLMTRLKNAPDSAEESLIMNIQKDINHLVILRSELARHIGDRILSPRRR